MPTKTRRKKEKARDEARGAVLERQTKGAGNKTPFTTIEDVLLSTNAPIEQKRIAHEVMALVGGERGLAQKILDEYNQTLPGSLARAKFFALVLTVIKMAVPKEVMGDLEHISEQDISSVLAEHCKDAGVQLGYPTHVCI